MTFVIAGSCVSDYSCVEVCPADSIHPTPDEPDFMAAEQLYIDPRTCVDCAACVEACPVGAVSDAKDVAPRLAARLQLVNAEYYEYTSRRG
ncbi:indolepyruvate ferredoxin oxidoreductase subunit alpha [Mycolicibacterium vinylchloridicum]|uniref:indolepyruvate ferredoxin oxidoreductase subunit alpha n=1 Tax=Mycolicibacterium vinylchloridicum TaxID=2736928 RepID=UPI0015C9517E|nr:ferredoxin family protein [Mycolicibacterium vinylchloridicum]